MEEWLVRLGVPASWVAVIELGLLGRLLLAALLGGLIGVEREISNKPAGLRTNLLICVGATLLMELSIGVAALALPGTVGGGIVRGDPARIAAQIVSGIGFLGAGTILQSRGTVTGLTTAATIWVVAAIGMAVGAQAYAAAIGTTVLVYLSLAVLSRFDRLTGHRRLERYLVSTSSDAALLDEIIDAFRARGMRANVISIEKQEGRLAVLLDAAGPPRLHEQAIRSLALRPDI